MMCIMINDDTVSQTISSRKRTLDRTCSSESMPRGKALPYCPVDKHRTSSHRRTFPTTPRGSTHDSLRKATTQVEIIPTADDYANLVFCDSEDDLSENNVDRGSKSATTQKQSKTNKRRRVSFSNTAPTIHHIQNLPKVSSMTLEQKSLQWLSPNDLEQIKSSAQTTIQHMRILARGIHDMANFRKMMKTLEEETDDSIRGLEHRVFRRKQTRKSLISNVLECQKHIQGLAKFDSDVIGEERTQGLLANVSMKGSKVALALALAVARDDAEEIHGNSQKRKVSTTADTI